MDRGILSCQTPKIFFMIPGKVLCNQGCHTQTSGIRDLDFCKDTRLKLGCLEASSSFHFTKAEKLALKAINCYFQVRVSYKPILKKVGVSMTLEHSILQV